MPYAAMAAQAIPAVMSMFGSSGGEGGGGLAGLFSGGGGGLFSQKQDVSVSQTNSQIQHLSTSFVPSISVSSPSARLTPSGDISAATSPTVTQSPSITSQQEDRIGQVPTAYLPSNSGGANSPISQVTPYKVGAVSSVSSFLSPAMIMIAAALVGGYILLKK